MKCSGCGAELAPDSKFCGECGAPRPEAPAPAVEVDRSGAQPAPVPVFGAAEAEAGASKKGSRGKWAAIGCIGLLAVACVVAGLTGICLLTLLSQPQGSPIALLDTATVEVFLDDEQVKPDTQSEIEYDFVDEGYVVSWSADVGTLTPGSHRLDYHVSWSRQISDGWHTYGPGGETEEEQEYCELIAE
jgi:hypothetical protein